MESLLDLARTIRTVLKQYRLTQEQLADLAGTSTRTVRDIEHGTGSTGIGTVAEVARVLGLVLRVEP